MDPSNPNAIDMRKTKLKPEEAALIAGELIKPSWASRNEGIHERVSFEDTLWGFEMAGGKYYNTPLRVVYVRPGSRAEHACIRMGDTVLRINGQDTSTLTLQEAHQLVLDSGIDLKIVVTAPEDTENSFFRYQDPMNEHKGPTPEELKAMEMERIRKALERASRCRELPWPWVRKNWTIYRESNCYMVPSKYENKHRDKFPELPPEQKELFFPAEKIKRGNKKLNEAAKNQIAEESTKMEENNSEDIIEEVEEEVKEEVEVEKIENEQNGIASATNNERIGHTENIKAEISNSKGIEEETTEDTSTEQEVENLNSLDSSNRKDSDQGYISNYEADNNNNHVVKSKNNEETEDIEHNDDDIINEIVANSNSEVNEEENVLKSDDDILDSVLNENIDSINSENER